MESYFHVGIVVADLDVARAHFTDLLGTEWGPIMETELPIRTGDGDAAVVPNRICYSTAPPYLELIQEVPGTPWVCNEHSNLHHLGFFVGVLGGEADRLVGAGCPLEIMGGQGEGPPESFTYHRDPLGVRVELVDAALRTLMEEHMFRPPPAGHG